jgi:hypothetical protein
MPKSKTTVVPSKSASKLKSAEAIRALVKKCVVSDTKEPLIRVDTDTKGAVKTVVMKAAVGDREMARTLFGMKPIKVVLIYTPIIDTSATNTAQVPVHNLDPTTANEWAGFSGLFDEARVLRAKSLAICTTQTTGAGGLPEGTQTWAMCFDPAVAGAVASVGGVLEHTKQAGPISYLGGSVGLSGGSSAGWTPSLLATSPHCGLMLETGPLARGALPLNSSGTLSPNPVQGDWFPTTSTTAIAGYVKFYCEATGANTRSQLRAFHWLSMEFRMRG